MYVSEERVVRDGRLVAFEGEEMTEEEAERRSLAPAGGEAERPARKRAPRKREAGSR